LNLISVVCSEFCRISGDKCLWNYLFAQRYKSVYMRDLRYLNIQDWKMIFQQENAIAAHGLVCFHSRASFRDDILGIPISVNKQNTRFPELSSSLDLLCWESYTQDSVRKSVWGQKFTHFLPIWINKEHGERSFTYICDAIRDLTFAAPSTPFEPRMAIQILPRLMNSMVVSVMSGNVHASIKALEGYCMFHRLLLEFVSRYPELQVKINARASLFVKEDDERHKDRTPNLGEFLPLVAVSTAVTWDDIALPYLEENFTRNVLWVIKKYPAMGRINKGFNPGEVDKVRLDKTLEASLVSQRLLAFHVFFYRHFARPGGMSLSEIGENYDRFYGRPSTEMKMNLQRKVFEILEIRTWPQFFTAIGMAVPSQAHLTQWLVHSVIASKKKNYHSDFVKRK